MPRQSYDAILNLWRNTTHDLAEVALDKTLGVYEYKALPVFLRREAEAARFVALVSIHDLTETRHHKGDAWTNGSIRRALGLRSPEVLLKAHWENEHQFVIVLSAHPEGYLDKLRAFFHNEGLEVSTSFVPYSGNIIYDHAQAEKRLL
jgi:hypothetical protein